MSNSKAMEYCPNCKADVIVYWGVCSVCGFDISHPENNKVKQKG